MERIDIEPISILRIIGAIVAIRYKTKATLILAANWAMRYSNCATTKYCQKNFSLKISSRAKEITDLSRQQRVVPRLHVCCSISISKGPKLKRTKDDKNAL